MNENTEQPDDASFRHLCANAGVGIIAANTSLAITYWNAAAARLLGASFDSMIGQQITAIVPAERREVANRLLNRALQSGEISEFEFDHHDNQGQKVELAVTISPLLDNAHERIGISIIIRNLTRRLDYEREQAQSRKMSALGVMAGAVAHHFNNLFGGIITAIDFSQASNDPRTLRRALTTTVTSLTRATEMTVRLLAFAEGDRSDSASRDLFEAVRQFLDDRNPEFNEKQIEVVTFLEDVHIELPRKQIQSILESLIANAVESMKGGGTMEVELKRVDDGKTVMLRVADTGTGLDEEQLARAFEPFYTSKPLGPHGEDHAGLGLAVVHGIVRDFGGSVTLSSVETGGAVCTVRFPTRCMSSHAPDS